MSAVFSALPTIEIRDTISAIDRGQMERVCLARLGLVSTLVRLEPVATCFNRLRTVPQFRQTISNLRKYIKTLPWRVALDRSKLMIPLVTHQRMLNNLTGNIFGENQEWLAGMLFICFIGEEVKKLKPELRCNLNLSGEPVDTDPIQIQASMVGLTRTETRQMMRQLAKEGRLSSVARKRGRVPLKKRAIVFRNAEWYARHFIDGISIRRLAREYHNAEHSEQDPDAFEHDCALVSRSIRQTSRLLNLPTRSLSNPPL